MKDKIKDIFTPFNIFATLVLLGFAGYLFYAVRYGGIITDWLMMENTDLGFCDLKMHVEFVADPKHLYERAFGPTGCFPPLSYVMYWFLYRLIYRGGQIPHYYEEIEHYPYLYFIIVMYSIVTVLLILAAIFLWGQDKKRNIVLFITLILSVPFYAGGISVANSTVLVMTLILIALKLKDSDDKWLRELAIIIIAVCAGFKIYPAVFGLFYLLEKRFKEAARLTVYGIVLFFSPFLLFGGAAGFKKWWDNIQLTMEFNDYGRIQCIRGLIYTIGRYFGTEAPATLLKLAPVVFAVLMVILACVSRSRVRKIFYLCMIMVFFPTNAYRYTLCYLSIPLIVYLTDKKSDEDRNIWVYIEMLMFACVYAVPIIMGKLMSFELTYTYYTLTYVEGWVYASAYLLLIVVIVHEIWDLRHAV